MVFFVSFLLEGILSMIFNIVPNLSLLSLIIGYHSYKEDIMIKVSLIMGVLYDIFYTNTLGFNMILFYLMLILIIKLFKKFKNSFINNLFATIFISIVYLLSSYLILILFNYLDFNFNNLLNGIVKIVPLNVIFMLMFIGIIEFKDHIFKKNT